MAQGSNRGSPYSSLKAVKHLDRLERAARGEAPAPVHVQLVISDLCNHDCHFCAYRWSGYTTNKLFTDGAELASFGHNNPKRMIRYEKVLEILDDCRDMGVRAIQLTGGGEPTVHPQFAEICQGVLDRGMSLAVVTNGAVLGEKETEILAGASWVRVSVDAAQAETYSRVRGVGQYVLDRVWKNIRSLAKARDRHAGESDLLLGVGFVVTAENWREVVDCARQAKECGADNFRISAVFQPDGADYFKGFAAEAAQLCREAVLRYQDASFRVFNMFGDRLGDLQQKAPDYSFCGYQHLCTYIGADLNVYRCCNTAYNPQGLLGSIAQARFRSFWLGAACQRKLQQFDAQTCERCQFNGKNRLILYLLDPEPRHKDFV